jgi:hypothetical protein
VSHCALLHWASRSAAFLPLAVASGRLFRFPDCLMLDSFALSAQAPPPSAVQFRAKTALQKSLGPSGCESQ